MQLKKIFFTIITSNKNSALFYSVLPLAMESHTHYFPLDPHMNFK